MQSPAYPQIDLDSTFDELDTETWRRGLAYARQGRVLGCRWDPKLRNLFGIVRGNQPVPTPPRCGWCRSTPAPGALTLDLAAARCTSTASMSPRSSPRPQKPPSSRRRLRQLRRLGGSRWMRCFRRPGERSHRDTAGDRAQLVGERAVAGPGRTAGAAGKRGGWVAGDLRWDRLHMLRYSDYPAAQVRLLQELYATYRTSRSNSTVYYGYSYGDEKTMALLRFDSPQLWPLLDEARRVGVRLLQPRPGRTFRRTPPRGCAWM
ncbi:hypothetical protein I553_2424 [Mycobacterium xenopi 4042]|uniref:Uncharacterized protein n=1 Tax=Mycobacterium xenopi 4042 TaxID=1299334 RepID=X8C9W4_MYCXE|nr:hypothetical protein I553_2424 [Mycobacterium xenopi 4042]